MMRDDGPPLVLASASATRRRLLEAAGIEVVVRPATVDEEGLKTALRAEGVAPGDAATALAEMKAQRASRSAPPDAIVLGADQILTSDGRWFDKPGSLDEARVHLRALSGKRHELHTAAVAFRGPGRVWHGLETVELWMRPLNDAFVERYLEAAGDAVLQSVGAYQLEGLGAHLFSRVEGDSFTIQGLPLLPLLAFLRDQGVVAA